MLTSWLFCVFTGIVLLSAPSSAAVTAAIGTPQGPAPSQAMGAILPAVPKVAATPTEGGDSFTFYNRQFIHATFTKNRQVLLTFDDGPNPNTTPHILDVLKRRNVKGVFFVVGVNVRKYPEILKRIHDEGHTIGNHTFYHLNLRQHGAERIVREIRDTNALIQQITGVKPTLFRPPYGAVNATVLETLRKEGMSVMLWSIDPGDWRNRNVSRTVGNLAKQLQLGQGGRGGIVLLHDTLPSTANALEPFLVALTSQGLLPRPFDGGNVVSRERSFWAATSPRPLRWNEADTLVFDPGIFQRRLLTALLQSEKKKEVSPLALLKARKTGNLYRLFLCAGRM
jgi:peptidoglycan/xylan/chitin deacetylase (PgdA/CDA1 family)